MTPNSGSEVASDLRSVVIVAQLGCRVITVFSVEFPVEFKG